MSNPKMNIIPVLGHENVLKTLKVLNYYIKNIIQAIILFIIIQISNKALLMKAICTNVY